jgi:hypothetical protein
LQCVLAAKILTVDFVVCALAVKKKIRVGFDMSDRTIPLSVSLYTKKLKKGKKKCFSHHPDIPGDSKLLSGFRGL